MRPAVLSRSLGAFVLFLSLNLAEKACAQHWNTTTGDWNVASNWLQNVVPSAGSYTYIINGGTSQLTTANGANQHLYITGGSTLEISGNGRLVSSAIDVYSQVIGTGTLSISGPSASATFSNELSEFAVGVGGTGVFNLSDGARLTVQGGNGLVALGLSGNGTVNIGTGGAAGILNAGAVSGVFNGTGALNFNHTDANYSFTKDGTSAGTGVSIQGTTRVSQVGSGMTTLSAASSYTGGTALNAGILSVAQDNHLGAATGTLTFAGGILQTTGTFTMNRATTLTGNGTFETAAATTLTQQGTVGGAGSLFKAGAGTLVLTGANDFTGGTTISAGTLRAAGSSSALGTGGVTLGGGNLELANDAATNFGHSVTLTSDSTITSDRLTSGAGVTHTLGTLTFSAANQMLTIAKGANVASGTAGVAFGTVNLLGAATFETGADTALSIDSLAGNGPIVKRGAGSMILRGAGTRTGGNTIVNGGTLRIESREALGTGQLFLNGGTFESATDTAGAIPGSDTTLGSSSTIVLNRLTAGAAITNVMGRLSMGNHTLSVVQGGNVTSGRSQVNFNISTLNGNATFDLGANTLLQLGTINDGGSARTLTKSGAGTLFLSAAATSVTNGTVFNLNNGILSIAASALGTGTRLNMAGGTSLEVNGATTLAELQGAGTVDLRANALTVQGSTNSTYGGVISNTGSLTKAGTGVLTLSGANTYSGATTVSGGTLEAGAAGAFASTSNHTVAGTLNLAGFHQTIGSLAGTGTVELGAAMLTMGNATNTTFSGSINGQGSLTKQGTGRLTLTGANAFSGVTTLRAGVLAFNNGSLGQGGLSISGGELRSLQDATVTGLSSSGGVITAATGTTLTFQGSMVQSNVTVGSVGYEGRVRFDVNLSLSGGIRTLDVVAGTASGLTDKFRTVTIRSGATVDDNVVSINSLSGGGRLALSGPSRSQINRGTFSGVISGAGGVEMAGVAGDELVLTGENTYSGATKITAGTLFIGDGGTSGSILSDVENDSALVFNRSNGMTYGGALSGGGSIAKRGAGQLTLTGISTNTDGMVIEAGQLAVNGTLGGAATVRSGTTLSGTGTVGGLVTVDNGGILAPGNSPGVLTVGALTLNNASILNYELGNPASDRIDVGGALTLDGILNVQAAVGFGAGTYRLMNYGTSLTNNSLVFGNAPSPFEYTLSLDTANQVNLIVTAATAQYWDGSQTTPNGVVNGGTGTWDTTTTNWTTSTGVVNAPWNGTVGAVFQGTAGTVTIADGATISAPLLSFQVDGYTLASAGTGQLALAGTGTVEVFTGATATISAAIASGQLTKTQGGMLILSGANTYAGGTTHRAGTIQIANDDAFGTGTVTLDGGSLSTDGQDHYLENDFVIKADTAIALPTSGVFDQLELLGDVDLDGGIRMLTLSGDGGGLCLNGVISNGGLNLQSNGDEVSVMFCGTTNTYTGLTTVGANVTLELGATGTAVAGDLLIQEDGVVAVGGVDQIADNVTVTVDGVLGFLGGSEQTIHNLQGIGGITSAALPLDVVLTVNSGTFSGQIVDGPPSSIELIKASTGSLTLSGVNTYSGGTSINAGTLITSNASALGTGAVSLGSAGTLAITAGTTLSNVTGLDWASGGTFAFTLGSLVPATEFLTIDGTITQSGTGAFVFADAGFLTNTTYDLITFDTAGSVLTNWTANMIGALEGSFAVRDNLDGTSTLTVTYAGSASGPVINNFAPDFTPTNANFQVSSQVTALPGAQQVRTLTFADGSTLTIMETLSVNGGNFTVANGSATVIGGTLLTPGDFTKLGGGLLDVLSNIITGGNTNIAAGLLAINGSLTTDNVLVQLGAWLKGSGLINGNVINNGTVAPGNSPGTLTVNGNFTQSQSGTLQIEVASDSVFDRLIVTGQASLAGTLQAVAFGGHQFAYGDQVPFLQAGSITGEFDTIVMPTNYRGRFLTTGGTGILLVAPSSYTLVAENQNQHNVAKALDSFIGQSGDRDTVSLALDLQTESAYGAAFEQIAPGFYQSLTDTVIELTNAQNQMLAQRLSAVRLGARGFSVIGLDQAPLANDVNGKNVMDAKDAKDIITPSSATPWSVFVMGNGIFARVTNVSQVPNYRFNSGGFLVGADYKFSPDTTGSQLIAGLYTGYQGTFAKYANGSRTTINSALFGGYASYSHGGFYSNLIVGGSYNGYRTARSIDFSTIDRTARSSPNGGAFTTYLDAGYDIQAGGFTFGPILSAQYTYAGTAGFTESGADSLDLKVGQQNANSIRTNIGGRIAFTWQVSDHITIIPEGRMFWQHEYLNGPRSLDASLNGGGGPGFEYTTIAPGRDSVFAGAGVSANFGDRWSTSLYYNANFAREDFVSHMISAGLGFKF